LKREEKHEKVKLWHELFANVEGAVFTGVSGLTVAQSTDLRRRFRAAGVSYQVVKNTLARRAFEGTDMAVATELLDGPTAIAWSDSDVTAAARVAKDFAKETDKFEIRGGFATGQKIDVNGVNALATMPSFDELRAQILGTINGVAAKLLAQISAPAQELVGILDARKEDLEKKEAA